ncbi:MAG: hypothetical protein IKL23_02780 [Oscillospiraceae bacterium]|nr:hypothetical protein [Oscillospiraceae bacterium]
MMLSTKHAALAIKILSLLLVAALSFFVATKTIPESDFVKASLESVEQSSNTVMKFSAATLSTSLAISALPDDFATPLAESLTDLNVYFIAILTILFLEKTLILYGIKAAFALLIPLACAAGILFVAANKRFLKEFAVRLCILALTVAFVVPCSTHLTDHVTADLMVYVNETIQETEDGGNKLNEAMNDSEKSGTLFEKLSDLFQSAIRDISDLMLHFQNTIRRCMNSIAILILANFIMPLLTFFLLKWILKETFHIALPAVSLHPPAKAAPETESELVAVGEETK